MNLNGSFEFEPPVTDLELTNYIFDDSHIGRDITKSKSTRPKANAEVEKLQCARNGKNKNKEPDQVLLVDIETINLNKDPEHINPSCRRISTNTEVKELTEIRNLARGHNGKNKSKESDTMLIDGETKETTNLNNIPEDKTLSCTRANTKVKKLIRTHNNKNKEIQKILFDKETTINLNKNPENRIVAVFKKGTGSQPNKQKRKQPKTKVKRVVFEIKQLQNYVGNIMPKLPFHRLIRDIIIQNSTTDAHELRISRTALEALQESSELYLTQFFQDSYRATLHRERITLMVKDMELTKYLRGRCDSVN